MVFLAACAAPPTVAPSPAPPTATVAPAATLVPAPTPRCPPSAANCPATRLSLAAPAGAVKVYDRVEFAAALADFRVASPTKPLLVGEHGRQPSGEPPNVELAASIVHFHNGLWAAPFSGLAGSALAWYWNDLVDPNGLWPQYKALATFFQGEDLAPTRAMTASLVSATAALTSGVSTAGAAGSGAIALSLQSPTHAMVWVRSQQFEATRAIVAYEKAVGTGPADPNWSFAPPVLSGLTLTVHGLQDGTYDVHWFVPQTGRWPSQSAAQATGGTLAVLVPDFSRDMAAMVTIVGK